LTDACIIEIFLFLGLMNDHKYTQYLPKMNSNSSKAITREDGSGPDNSTVFDKEINALFNHLKTVVKARDAAKLKLSGNAVNPILKWLNKYAKAYEYSEPELHKEYFANIFTKYRVPILKGYKNDKWLRQNNVVIQFGEGVDQVNKEIRIMLSSIYTTACQLKKEAEDSLEGFPEEAWESCQELIYPDIIMLHLYRLFRESLPSESEDYPKLQALVSEIETDLGIDPSTTAPPTSATPNLGGGFSQLIGMVSTMLPKLGITPPDGSKLPTETDINNVMGKVINNPQTQSMISNVLTSLSECKDITQVIHKLSTAIGDPKLGELASSTIESAMASAPNQPSGPVGSEAPTASTAPAESGVQEEAKPSPKVEDVDN
jgi:hypothetical protein